MTAETKVCRSCQNSFTVEPEDFAFYEHIKTPPPTFCPDCRLQRRYAVRNQMNLYRIKCGLCGKDMVSMYSAEKPFPVYCQKCWWSDAWDPASYGCSYDFSKPFFTQFYELSQVVPHLSLMNQNAINSEYCNHSLDNKNCYLCFSIGKGEDCYYVGPQAVNNKSCVACSMVRDNELGVDLVDCEKCYRTVHSQNCVACLNSALLYDCRNCQDCVGCVNLRNKQYYVLNQPYSKEGYLKKLNEINLKSHKSFLSFKKQFCALVLRYPHRYARIEKSVNVTGDNILESKNCFHCFAVEGSEDCKYSLILNSGKNSFDVNNCYPSTERSYEAVSPVESSEVEFCSTMRGGTVRARYSDTCASCSDIFGCISLKGKQYSVLNKQYTKKEYEDLLPRIVKHMSEVLYTDRKGRTYGYGEFFPIELSPFGYNETVSAEYFPLEKEEALREGYLWADPEGKPRVATMTVEKIPDDVTAVGEDIANEVIECKHRGECNENCTKVFRVLAPELNIYKTLGTSLPHLCPNCRSVGRIKRRNPIHLWNRKCQCGGGASENSKYTNTAVHHHHGAAHCPNEFETSYAPERPEIVYCEQCYQAEVV